MKTPMHIHKEVNMKRRTAPCGSRGLICVTLGALRLAPSVLVATAAAASDLAPFPGEEGTTRQKPTVKERMAEVAPGSLIEVRFHNKQKVRGRLGDVADESFSLQTAQGDKIQTQQIAFTDVKSFKKVKGTVTPSGGKNVLYVLAGVGIITVILMVFAISKGLGD